MDHPTNDTIEEDDPGEQTIRKIVPNVTLKDVFGEPSEQIEEVRSDMIIACYPIIPSADDA